MASVKINYTNAWYATKENPQMRLGKALVLEDGGLSPILSDAKPEYDALCRSMIEFIKKAEKITSREARVGKLEIDV